MTRATKDGQAQAQTPVGVWLLAIGLFLACVFGGYIASDASQLAPGAGVLLQNIFGGSDAPFLTHAVISLPLIGALVVTLLSRRIQQVPTQIFTAVWLFFFFFLGISTLFSSFKALSIAIWFEWLVYGCVLFGVVTCAGRTRGPLLLMASLAAGCGVVALYAVADYDGARLVVAALLLVAIVTGIKRWFAAAGCCLAGAAICSFLMTSGLISQDGWRVANPTYRVFGGWINPNATAALLVAGFFVAVGLCLSRKHQTAFLAGLAAVLMAYAIFLTGSKGTGSLALPIGTVAFGAALTKRGGKAGWGVFGLSLATAVLDAVLFKVGVGWLGLPLSLVVAIGLIALVSADDQRGERIVRLVAIYVAASLLITATVVGTLQGTNALNHPAESHSTAPTAMSPVARIATGGNTQEQSSAFRVNLIKSSIHLIKEKPLTGWGMATYRYESGRAGLTTATVFAHNTYLQIFAESGVIAFGLFLFGMGVWFWLMVRNHTRLPQPATAPLAGVLAAVISLLAHSLVDSDLYYFGIGILFFAVLGIGLLLSVDSVAPEFVFKQVRVLGTVGLVCLALVLFGGAYTDALKSRARFDLFGQPDPGAVQDDESALSSLESFDGDAAYLDAELKARLGASQGDLLQRAYELAPAEKVARSLARQQADQGNPAAAADTLKLALRRDPNNLITLTALMKLYHDKVGDTESAVATARRLVGVEDTDYFKIRSIPESVPTETYDARFDVLAPNEPDPRKRADLLAEGVRGMLEYANVTAKYIVGNSGDGKQPDIRVPGYDSLNEARAKLDKAAKAADEAARLYRGLGETTLAAEMEADGPVFRGALGGADSAK